MKKDTEQEIEGNDGDDYNKKVPKQKYHWQREKHNNLERHKS